MIPKIKKDNKIDPKYMEQGMSEKNIYKGIRGN